VKAAVVPALSIVGSELVPFAAMPFAPMLITLVSGVQAAMPKQVLRKKTSDDGLVSVRTRLCDADANATN
jgi:hypothetical protein